MMPHVTGRVFRLCSQLSQTSGTVNKEGQQTAYSLVSCLFLKKPIEITPLGFGNVRLLVCLQQGNSWLTFRAKCVFLPS